MSSADLHDAGASLRSKVADLDAQLLNIQQNWFQALSGAGTDGEGPAAAERQATMHIRAAQRALFPLHDAVRILLLTAELEAPLESARHAIKLCIGHTPLGLMLVQQLRAMSRTLDAACAAHLHALCTPEARPSALPFTESTHLSAEEIHQRSMSDAPPQVQDLLLANPDVTLLEAGPDTLVLALGDIDTADSVTTVVAGVGSSEPDSWPRQVDRLRAIHPGGTNATVLWLGYRAPSTIPAGLGGAAAQRAAPELRAFQRELALRHPEQRRVVLGYSYGSVVAGAAAVGQPGARDERAERGAQGARGGPLAADALILVGSPGVPADHALDLQVPEVYAVTGSADQITLSTGPRSGAHGANPAYPDFGATTWPSRSDHSSYFEDPDFQRRVREVIRGTGGG